MRKRFLEPEIDVIRFGEEDIITTSGNGDIEENEDGGDVNWPPQ